MTAHNQTSPRSPSLPIGPGSPPGGPERVGGRPLTLWPLDVDRYGLDVTFHGHWACEDAEREAERMRRRGIAAALRPEPDGGWTVRAGPLHSLELAQALGRLTR